MLGATSEVPSSWKEVNLASVASVFTILLQMV